MLSRESFISSALLGYAINGGEGSNPIENGLFAFYTLDEIAAPREDCGPNGFTANPSGGVGNTDEGILNNAAVFNGSFARLVTSSDPLIDDVRGKSFTIAGWVKIDAGLSQAGVVASFATGGAFLDALAILFYDTASDSLVLYVNDNLGGGVFVGAQLNGTVPRESWVFCTADYNADTFECRIFLNDEPTGGVVNLGGLSNSPSNLMISIGSNPQSGNAPLLGWVDNLAYYVDTLLPPSGRQFYFNGGGLRTDVVGTWFFNNDASFFNDASINDIDLTSGGGTNYIAGPKDGAIEFDGIVGGAISMASTALDALRENDFTITLMGYIDAAHPASGDANFLSLLSGFGTGELLITITYGGGDGVSANLYSNGGANQDGVFQQIGGTIPRDTWFSIQLTYSATSGVMRMRLNDQAFGSVTAVNPTNVNGGLRVDVGNLLGFVFFLDGRIAEPVIYDSVQNDVMLSTRRMDNLVTRPYNPGQPCTSVSQSVIHEGVDVVYSGDPVIYTT